MQQPASNATNVAKTTAIKVFQATGKSWNPLELWVSALCYLCVGPREVVGSIGSSLAAVICGGDSGVNATDALSDALDLRGNGMRHGNRRDKLVQHQALEAAGLRFARTVSGTTWEEAGENVVLGPLHDVI